MKKFISFVMAAAMVASLVPATAFAKGDVTMSAKVLDAQTISKDSKGAAIVEDGGWVDEVPELRLTVTGANYRSTELGDDPELDVTVSLDNAEWALKDDVRGFALPDGSTKNYDAGTTIQQIYDDAYAAESVAANKKASAFNAIKPLMEDLVTVYYTDDRGNSVEAVLTAGAVAGTDEIYAVIDANNKVVATLTKKYSTDYAAKTDWDAINHLIARGEEFTVDAQKTGSVATAVWYMENGGTAATDAVPVVDDDGSTLLVNDDVFAGYVKNAIAAVPTGNFYSAATCQAAEKLSFDTTAGADKIVVSLHKWNLTVGAGAATALSSANVGDGTFTIATGDLEDEAEKAYTDENGALPAGQSFARGHLTNKPLDDGASPVGSIKVDLKDWDNDQAIFTFTGKFAKDDYVAIDLCSLMDKRGTGRDATVSVSSDAVSSDDMIYVSVKSRGITASTKKIASVAQEEMTRLEKDLVVKSSVGDFADGQKFELKLSKGFEFVNKGMGNKDATNKVAGYTWSNVDGNTANLTYVEPTVATNEFTIDWDDMQIEATSAKSGATCTLTIKAIKDSNVANSFSATTTVEIAKVVDYKVVLSKDEDEDLPVIYSGVDVDNYGITDDSDHWSVEVTAEETFPGAWSFRKGFNFELPEHVFVADVEVIETEGILQTRTEAENTAVEVDDNDVYGAFFEAYQEGSHVNFEFKKRVFDDVDSVLNKDKATMTFKLQLVADPTFEGDVTLKLTGELVDDQELVIAKFVKPYTVKAEQNDIIIDYRYTDIPTAITITEAEAGLWAKDEARFDFYVEKSGNNTFMSFEDDPTFEVDSKSDMELKKAEVNNNGEITFTVKSESDEAATITIKDMQLFMNRSIPAGPYDLEISSSLEENFKKQALFAQDCVKWDFDSDTTSGSHTTHSAANKNEDNDCFVDDVDDYSTTVKEGFVNVVTAGRDVDDASFTTKVVVPVGENYIVAGEKQIELDTPAYINAAGYTMLPIRAVATALGISNNNVLWDQPTKTVTILYGQRIITMTQGQKVVYVNGSAIPASAAVENTNSRTFLPMRDLATALGVTDITWDQATRTATLNGNQK